MSNAGSYIVALRAQFVKNLTSTPQYLRILKTSHNGATANEQT